MLAGLVLANFNLPISRQVVHWSYDLPFLRRPVEVPDDVRMVYLNDDAHQTLNQPRSGAWDRNIHARLVEQLTAAGARAVVFDIVFTGPSTNAAADERFAAAIRRHGRVILAAEYLSFSVGGAEMHHLQRPYDSLREAAAGLGISQTTPDEDFEVRRHYHGPMQEPEPVVSESWAAAKLVGAPVAQRDETRAAHRWMNYYGPPLTLPAAAIHQAIEPEGVAPGFFSNKVVFVGSLLPTGFSGERKDEFRSPFSVAAKDGEHSARYMPGVEVHATMFLNLLRGDWLRRSSGEAELIGAVLFGAVFGWGLVQLRPLVAALVAVLAMAGVAGAGYQTFTYGHFWFPWLVAVVQVFVAMNFAVIFNSIQLYVQKKLLEQTLGLYVSPKLVRRVAGNPEMMRKFTQPGAEKQTLTILFTDIANFTSISEGMDSDDLALQMNRYFQTAVSRCIHPQDGTVVKYIGDAIFAFWNAPEAQADHALRACRAALSFGDQEAQRLNGQPLFTRLGLHTGEANVGNFGSTQKVDYTALGENINLASRMEGLNKHLGTTVLATGETIAAVRDQIVARRCGVFRLKGFGRGVEVFELVGAIERAAATREWRESFAAALENFQRQDFSAAETGFRRVLELKPGDGPSEFYLRVVEELRAAPPAADWHGEVELKEK